VTFYFLTLSLPVFVCKFFKKDNFTINQIYLLLFCLYSLFFKLLSYSYNQTFKLWVISLLFVTSNRIFYYKTIIVVVKLLQIVKDYIPQYL